MVPGGVRLGEQDDVEAHRMMRRTEHGDWIERADAGHDCGGD